MQLFILRLDQFLLVIEHHGSVLFVANAVSIPMFGFLKIQRAQPWDIPWFIGRGEKVRLMISMIRQGMIMIGLWFMTPNFNIPDL